MRPLKRSLTVLVLCAVLPESRGKGVAAGVGGRAGPPTGFRVRSRSSRSFPILISFRCTTLGRSRVSFYYVYYVMPYAEGESLRSRLRREHELPIPDAGLAASAKPEGRGVCASLALGVRGGQYDGRRGS